MKDCSTTIDIVAIIFSAIGVIISAITAWRDWRTRKEVKELRTLEIEKIRHDLAELKKAKVFCYIHEGYFVIENKGNSDATNIRYSGWDDSDNEIKNNIVSILPAHHKQKIKLSLLISDDTSTADFEVTWDDEYGIDNVWSNH